MSFGFVSLGSNPKLRLLGTWLAIALGFAALAIIVIPASAVAFRMTFTVGAFFFRASACHAETDKIEKDFCHNNLCFLESVCEFFNSQADFYISPFI